MNGHRVLAVAGSLVLAMAWVSPASAQTTQDVNARLASQADRIASGVRDGSVAAGETARLEREQSTVAREETQFLRDGTSSGAERARLERDLNRTSRDIYGQRHDAQVNPNPNGLIDQRRANGEKRIADGIRDGSLTPDEAMRLQRCQSRISREEQQFRADGSLSPAERQNLRQDVNRASGQIWSERHDAQGNLAATPYLDKRMENQQSRIDAGIADGKRDRAPAAARELHCARRAAIQVGRNLHATGAAAGCS
jgi:hypothetical protein